jgi:hypothetical protein
MAASLKEEVLNGTLDGEFLRESYDRPWNADWPQTRTKGKRSTVNLPQVRSKFERQTGERFPFEESQVRKNFNRRWNAN